MNKRLFTSAITIVTLLILGAATASAALSSRLTDSEAQLQKLYASLLRTGPSAYIERQIAASKVQIRLEIDDELNDVVNTIGRPGSGGVLSLLQSLERQRAIVRSLEEHRDESKANLELLVEEERNFYGTAQVETGATLYRITQDEPELLARRAVQEERLKSAQFFLNVEENRLQQLQSRQRLQQFSIAFTAGKYLFVIAIVVIVERLMRQYVFARIKSRNRRYAAKKLFTALFYAAVGLWVFAQIFAEHPGIVTSFAIVGAGVAVALQDVLKDIVGWILIVERRLYFPGERIAVGNITGDVIDISLLRTTLLEVWTPQMTDVSRIGQAVAVPNSMVLRESVINYHATSDFVDAEIQVILTYDSDMPKAQTLLQEVLKQETQAFAEQQRRQSGSRMQYYYASHEPHDGRVFMEPIPSGILCTLRFPVPITERRTVVTRVVQAVLAKIADEQAISVASAPNTAMHPRSQEPSGSNL